MKQIGRNIIHEGPPRQEIKLSFVSKIIKAYYEFRMKLNVRRKEKYATFSLGYRNELFNACIYTNQAYLHKVEALYLKDELRMLKKNYKHKERRKTNV